MCGGGCIGAIGISALLIFFGGIYYLMERVKKEKVAAAGKEKDKEQKDDADDDADDADGGD
jgi:hypothetical protein